MAYNQQQPQQQYIISGEMLNIGEQVIQQPQQYITVDQHAMAASIGMNN